MMYKKRIKKIMSVMVYSLLLSTLLTGCNKTAGQLGMMPGSSSNQAAKEAKKLENCPVCFEEKILSKSYGVSVCDPCRLFFLRIVQKQKGQANPCSYDENCQQLRKCQHCRYKKCLEVGMVYEEREESSKLKPLEEGEIPCQVCFVDKANPKQHSYGVDACHGCKAFFKRMKEKHNNQHVDPNNFICCCRYGKNCHCKGDRNCQGEKLHSHNACHECRYKKCLEAGMKMEKDEDEEEEKEKEKEKENIKTGRKRKATNGIGGPAIPVQEDGPSTSSSSSQQLIRRETDNTPLFQK